MIDPDDPFAAARRDTAPLPRHAVHARVLHVPLTASAASSSGSNADVGTFAWNLVVWDDPGGAPALHAALRPLVEATLLTELSAPFDTPDDERPAFVVVDGNYVSARWPGDAHTFARRFAALLR